MIKITVVFLFAVISALIWKSSQQYELIEKLQVETEQFQDQNSIQTVNQALKEKKSLNELDDEQRQRLIQVFEKKSPPASGSEELKKNLSKNELEIVESIENNPFNNHNRLEIQPTRKFEVSIQEIDDYIHPDTEYNIDSEDNYYLEDFPDTEGEI